MLTNDQKNKVIQLLGYGGKSLQVGSVIYNKIMNDRLANLPDSTEAVVISYLAQVAAIECQLAAAPARLAAKQVDGLTMNLEELQMLRKERKKIARELAQHLDIPYIGPGGSSMGIVV